MLHSLFIHADQLLSRYRPFWQFQPFYLQQLSQCSHLPEDLLAGLDKMDQTTFERLRTDSASGRAWLGQWVVDIEQIHQLEQQITGLRLTDPSTSQTDACLNLEPLATGIPGKKWQQIVNFSAFLSGVDKMDSDRQLLEWCAGKGYLGRLMSVQNGYGVTSLEWQQPLCEQGDAQIYLLKKRYPQLDQSMVQGDALAAGAKTLLSETQSAVALHACGDLHTRLIRLCAETGQHLKQVAIAPCCYHLTEQENYQPCSTTGQASELRLSRQDLKIPLQETVTGGKRIQRLRDQELHWRLSFDSLRQQLTGVTEYKPLPSFAKKLLSADYREFVHWALINRQLMTETELYEHPVSNESLDQSLKQGEERLRRVRKLEWLQSFFRRLLEIWLVADRGLALQEAGFHVELHQFCDKSVSPRNLLIRATR